MTSEGNLYTWGDGAAQNLGYGDTLRQVIPRRVDFGSAQHVLQVCSILLCDDGRLVALLRVAVLPCICSLSSISLLR